MIITENTFSKTVKPNSSTFKVQEFHSSISPSGEEVRYLIQENPISLQISQENLNLNIIEQKIELTLNSGIKGDKGDKGDTGESGASSSYTYVAGEILGGHRVIIIDNNLAYYADNTNLSHVNKPIGISNNASISGGNVTVVFYGEMEESSWNWDITKPIWISTNGLLTQTPAISGFSCIIATPITTTKIFIEKQEIFIL
jgi:hypothetical protein